jgi:hypothetical protein
MNPASAPGLEEFTSARLVYRNGDLFNPPALTNFLGCLQAAPDILAVQHLTFAPYSLGESWLGALELNDRRLHTTAAPIEFQWRPDRITRWTRHDDFALESICVMGVRRQTVTVALRVTNEAPRARPLRLRILTGEGILCSDKNWKTPYSPRECPAISTTPWDGTPPAHTLVRNVVQSAADGHGLIFTSRTSTACALQACSPAPDRIERRWLDFSGELAAGATRTLHFFIAVGRDESAVLAEFAAWRTDPAAALAAAESDWRAEIAAVFTPGNDRYSGHLPVLHTRHDGLRAVYLNAVITAVYFKREHPESPHGRTYVTLMPRYWVTTSFINDWSLSALLLILLDPHCARRTIERWLERDIHRHFGTEYASGDSTGNWYSCNDYAMARLITIYLRVTGDRAWLQHRVGERTVLEHLRGCAGHYRTLIHGHGLADYGDRNSLLEAVGTYEHEVASLNAANVWTLRETANVLEWVGDPTTAASLRAEATALVPAIQQLYVAGQGFWHCRRPDGSLVPVRHIWDFIHTVNFLHNDLPRAQVAEMLAFFQRELMTPAWLSALSPQDEDTGFSLRPDHQWNGSYPAWVSLAGSALLKAGRADLFATWLPGLAATARQGPYSQAHFVESAAPTVDGGARKAPTEWPYINDWTCLSAGNFFETVVLGAFGLEPGFARLEAHPQLQRLDATATLRGLRWQGGLYEIAADGCITSLPS